MDDKSPIKVKIKAVSPQEELHEHSKGKTIKVTMTRHPTNDDGTAQDIGEWAHRFLKQSAHLPLVQELTKGIVSSENECIFLQTGEGEITDRKGKIHSIKKGLLIFRGFHAKVPLECDCKVILVAIINKASDKKNYNPLPFDGTFEKWLGRSTQGPDDDIYILLQCTNGGTVSRESLKVANNPKIYLSKSIHWEMYPPEAVQKLVEIQRAMYFPSDDDASAGPSVSTSTRPHPRRRRKKRSGNSSKSVQASGISGQPTQLELDANAESSQSAGASLPRRTGKSSRKAQITTTTQVVDHGSSASASTSGNKLSTAPKSRPSRACRSAVALDRSATTDAQATPHPQGLRPHEHDVKCGRAMNHPGNILYRKLVRERKVLYCCERDPRKRRNLANEVYNGIKEQDPPGRFLKYDEERGLWLELDKPLSMDKICMALREHAAKIQKASAGIA